MTKLSEQSRWHESVNQISNNDFVRGGESGAVNQQAAQLAGRTRYLKNRIDTLQDLAQSPFLIYDTPALAQSAIAAGTERRRFFDVRAQDNNNVFDVYENVAGIATYTGTSTKGAAFIDALARKLPTIPPEWVGAFLDEFGNIGAGLRDSGAWAAHELESRTSTLVDEENHPVMRLQAQHGGFSVYDDDGNVFVDINRDGRVRVGELEVFNLVAGSLDLATAKIPPAGAVRDDTLGGLADYVGLAGMASARGNKIALLSNGETRALGVVLKADPNVPWMSSQVESPFVWFDDADMRLHMVFTAYSGTYSKPGVGSIGHTTSLNGVDWDKPTQLLAGSGIAGTADKSGCTGPVMVKGDDGIYHLFYIGLPEDGYEGGVKRLCLATTPSLSADFERRGVMIDISATAPWRSSDVYHASIVTRLGKHYCFFNSKGKAKAPGNDSQGNERIGYAVADSLLGPWVVDDANAPIVNTQNNTWKSQKVGDPCVWRDGPDWFMQYFGYDGKNAYDSIAITHDDDFPLGWREYGKPTLVTSETSTFEYIMTHKPFVIFIGSIKFYFYTGVGSARTICLAISGSGIDTRFRPGADGKVRDVITPSRGAGKAVDVFRSEAENRQVIEVGTSSGMEYSISRTAENGYEAFLGLRFDGSNTVIGGSLTLSADATKGFAYLPTINGTPTGTPVTKAGAVPVCIDIQNNQLCVFTNNAWRFSPLKGQ